ncbi:MAG: hypothetical protein M1827_003262 [Pycnora praestabilis]|nr:MAG: hypothetical protein M1827_003262 [Pycnora praestabilis]
MNLPLLRFLLPLAWSLAIAAVARELMRSFRRASAHPQDIFFPKQYDSVETSTVAQFQPSNHDKKKDGPFNFRLPIPHSKLPDHDEEKDDDSATHEKYYVKPPGRLEMEAVEYEEYMKYVEVGRGQPSVLTPWVREFMEENPEWAKEIFFPGLIVIPETLQMVQNQVLAATPQLGKTRWEVKSSLHPNPTFRNTNSAKHNVPLLPKATTLKESLPLGKLSVRLPSTSRVAVEFDSNETIVPCHPTRLHISESVSTRTSIAIDMRVSSVAKSVDVSTKSVAVSPTCGKVQRTSAMTRTEELGVFSTTATNTVTASPRRKQRSALPDPAELSHPDQGSQFSHAHSDRILHLPRNDSEDTYQGPFFDTKTSSNLEDHSNPLFRLLQCLLAHAAFDYDQTQSEMQWETSPGRCSGFIDEFKQQAFTPDGHAIIIPEVSTSVVTQVVIETSVSIVTTVTTTTATPSLRHERRSAWSNIAGSSRSYTNGGTWRLKNFFPRDHEQQLHKCIDDWTNGNRTPTRKVALDTRSPFSSSFPQPSAPVNADLIRQHCENVMGKEKFALIALSSIALMLSLIALLLALLRYRKRTQRQSLIEEPNRVSRKSSKSNVTLRDPNSFNDLIIPEETSETLPQPSNTWKWYHKFPRSRRGSAEEASLGHGLGLDGAFDRPEPLANGVPHKKCKVLDVEKATLVPIMRPALNAKGKVPRTAGKGPKPRKPVVVHGGKESGAKTRALSTGSEHEVGE